MTERSSVATTNASTRVRTPYGNGTVTHFRKSDSMYTVKLNAAATLYTLKVDLLEDPKAEALLKNANGTPLFPLLYKLRQDGKELMNESTKQFSSAIKQKGVQDRLAKVKESSKSIQDTFSRSMQKKDNADPYVRTPYGFGRIVQFREQDSFHVIKLDFGGVLYTQQRTFDKSSATGAGSISAAFDVSETMRRQKLEEDCARLGIPYTEEAVSTCLTCLVTPKQDCKAAMLNADGNPRFPRMLKWRQSGADLIESKIKQKPPSPCLLCGSMSCRRHASDAFSKEGITVCQHCLEDLEYDLETAETIEELRTRTGRLVELYSRAVLLLQYSSQFIAATADQLEANTATHNDVAVKSSSAGIVSGVLGVAAACTIMTPAGPPLLVATLVFGGGATAVQTGSEAYKYYSEPNQLANRILALNGMVQIILNTMQKIRETTLLPYLDQAVLDIAVKSTATTPVPSLEKNKVGVRAGARMGSNAATGVASLAVQETAVAGRFVSRATTAAARTARFARFAGGALSAATLVLEARELSKTLEQIQCGNPCEKAVTLRGISKSQNELPSTSRIQSMCHVYTKVRSKQLFLQAMTGSMVVQHQEVDDLVLAEEVVSSLEANQDNISLSSSRMKLSSKASLLDRVKKFKEMEAEKEKKIDETNLEAEMKLTV